MHRLTVAAAALAATLAAASPALAEDTRMPRLISLSGHGEMRMAPDMAFVTTGVLSQGVTAADALAANTAAMNALFAALTGAGIAEKDVQTSNFFVQPRYNFQDGKAPELIGYDVSNTVTVIVRKIGDLGPLLDKVVQAGSNQINGISFGLQDPKKAEDAARREAVEALQAKASLYSGALNKRIIRIVNLSEGGGYSAPQPVLMLAMARMEKDSSTPVSGGELTVRIDVTGVYEITR